MHYKITHCYKIIQHDIFVSVLGLPFPCPPSQSAGGPCFANTQALKPMPQLMACVKVVLKLVSCDPGHLSSLVANHYGGHVLSRARRTSGHNLGI